MIASAMLAEGTTGATNKELIENFKFTPKEILSDDQLRVILGKSLSE